MGKYTSTRAFQRDRDRSRAGDENTFSSIPDYLTEVPKDEGQFRMQSFLYGFDPTGLYRGYLSSRDLGNYWSDYLSNTGLSWSDIKYPTMMMGFGNSGSLGRNALTVSRNIFKLFK